jgi:hypothetical protein
MTILTNEQRLLNITQALDNATREMIQFHDTKDKINYDPNNFRSVYVYYKIKEYNENIKDYTECLLDIINECPEYNPAPELLVEEDKVFSNTEFESELKQTIKHKFNDLNRYKDLFHHPRIKTGIECLNYKLNNFKSYDGLFFTNDYMLMRKSAEYKHFQNIDDLPVHTLKELKEILKINQIKGRSKCKTQCDFGKLFMSF